MKTPDDIKKGLFCCWEDGFATCPYDDDCTMGENFMDVARDALAYIQHLESRLAQAERERDAAVNDLNEASSCRTCAYGDIYDTCMVEGKCARCDSIGCPCAGGRASCLYKWRGVCDENTREGRECSSAQTSMQKSTDTRPQP